MSGVQDSLDIKFRLIDGSDIGPKSFPVAASIVSLKESILSQWPKEKDNAPRTVKDVKLISGGKILENNGTVGECRSTLYDVPGGITTMHVIVSQPPQKKGYASAWTTWVYIQYAPDLRLVWQSSYYNLKNFFNFIFSSSLNRNESEK